MHGMRPTFLHIWVALVIIIPSYAHIRKGLYVARNVIPPALLACWLARSEEPAFVGNMTSALVKDRCWTVPIVAACCAFITLFTSSSAGLMYILFMEEFRISHEQAAWPQSTDAVVGNCIGEAYTMLV
ncbi:hypothetical protein MTO96_029676 [Rhipicephalus appendiculatus]